MSTEGSEKTDTVPVQISGGVGTVGEGLTTVAQTRVKMMLDVLVYPADFTVCKYLWDDIICLNFMYK